jgi:alpha-glucosidase
MLKHQIVCVLGILFAQVCSSQVVVDSRHNDGAKDWWETAAFYQIYPRSFKDSDGDGIGDLRGIADPLVMNYVQNIGIKAFWLSPIFKSPMADFG